MVHQTTPETLESGIVTAVLDEYWEFLLARLKEYLDPEDYQALTPAFYQHFKLEHREYISNPTLKC